MNTILCLSTTRLDLAVISESGESDVFASILGIVLIVFGMGFIAGITWEGLDDKDIAFKTHNMNVTYILTKDELNKVREYKIKLVKERIE